MNGHLESILRNDLKLPPDRLTPDTGLNDAGFDSLAIVELSVLLVDRFGIDVTETDIKAAATLGQLDQLIQRKQDER
ncbi:acyl carrier protein [Streptomyces sp. MS1.AVA.4]|uniref:Acyl carrier protein n=1 Tax=Streptomyces pratisoli TaxID=3139917 RepID=A0ACC6QGW2_9ACTN